MRKGSPYFLVVVVLLAKGCAFRTPTPVLSSVLVGNGPGPAKLSVEVISVSSGGTVLDAATQAAVRKEAAKILGSAGRKSAKGGGAVTVVRVSVDLKDHYDVMATMMRQDGCASLGYVAYPAGVTYEEQKLAVDVTVERNGHTWVGHGEADKDGSMYAPARKRALAFALDRALADAASKSP